VGADPLRVGGLPVPPRQALDLSTLATASSRCVGTHCDPVSVRNAHPTQSHPPPSLPFDPAPPHQRPLRGGSPSAIRRSLQNWLQSPRSGPRGGAEAEEEAAARLQRANTLYDNDEVEDEVRVSHVSWRTCPTVRALSTLLSVGGGMPVRGGVHGTVRVGLARMGGR